MARPSRRLWWLGLVGPMFLLGACAEGANHTLHELNQMPIIHTPPPGGTAIGTQQDKGTIAGRQAGILTIYATSLPQAAVVAYYRTAYPYYHFELDSSPPTDTYSLVGSHSYSGGTANVFVRIRTGTPWIEQGYDLSASPAPRGAAEFVTVLLLGVPD